MRRNQYRAWSQDGRVLSQWKEVPLQECTECHAKVDTRMELINHETGKCEACTKKSKKA